MMSSNLQKRLERLQSAVDEELAKSPYVELSFADGHTEKRKFLPLLFETYSRYSNDEPLPRVKEINYLFDESKQGQLPELLRYLLTSS